MHKTALSLPLALGLIGGLMACQSAGPTPDGTSGLRGQITRGPVCPGPAQPSCPDEPYQTTLTILSATGARAAQTASQANGTYVVALFPGRYTVVPSVPPGGFPYAAPVSVTVAPNTYTTLNIAYDTGLR